MYLRKRLNWLMVRLGESKETRCANLSFSAPGLTVADGCMDHKQASSVELLVSRIFGGRSHSTVRASSQFNTFINCHSQVIAPDQHPGLILPYFLLSARVKTFRPFAIPIRHIPTKKHSSHGTTCAGCISRPFHRFSSSIFNDFCTM